MLAASRPALAAPGLDLRVFAAPGYDTNVTREASYEPGDRGVEDVLGQVILSAGLRGTRLRGLRYTGSLDAGWKTYRDVDGEDTFALRYGSRLTLPVVRGTALNLSLSGKARNQPHDRRSYRVGRVGLRVATRLGRITVSPGLALKSMTYLPRPEYDHRGVGLDLSLAWASGPWALVGVGRVMALGFEGGREDRLLVARATASYAGPVVVRGGGVAMVERSSERAAGFGRVAATGSLAFSGLGLLVNLAGTFMFSRYDDPTPRAREDPTRGLEDEDSRSSVILTVRRPLGSDVALEARLSRYFTVGPGPGYERTVVLCGVRYGE